MCVCACAWAWLRTFSLSNLAECTPSTTTPSLGVNSRSKRCRSGRMWIQFIQQYVKKSRTTILPDRSLLADRGRVVLNHSQSVQYKTVFTLGGSDYEIDHYHHSKKKQQKNNILNSQRIHLKLTSISLSVNA